jgi:hypothetical protein
VVKWLPRRRTAAEIAAAPFDLDDARLVVARGYDFADWEALAEHVEAVRTEGSVELLPIGTRRELTHRSGRR